MKMSIDRLTICGNLSGDLEGFFRRSQFVKTRKLAAFPYQYMIEFLDGSVLQVAGISERRSGKVKELRYDFNPNNTAFEKLHMQVVGLMKDIHLTRCDVAFDVRNVDMSNWRWVDSKGRPYSVYYSGNGEIETWYVGGVHSAVRIRIYNKAKEQKKKDVIWWRVEVQMRGDWADALRDSSIVLENPFKDVTAVTEGDFSFVAGVRERALMEYLIRYPTAFGELSSKTRAKYRKLIRGLASWECIDFARAWEEYTPDIYSDVHSWCSLAYTNDTIQRKEFI